MKFIKRIKFFITVALVLLLCDLAANQSSSSKVPIPPGTDIRKIRAPSDLKAADLSALSPTTKGIRYYYQLFENKKKEGATSHIEVELHFISLLDVDYLGMDRFASQILAPVTGNVSVDGVMAAMPNLMAYLKQISVGDVKRHVDQVGKYQKVTLEFVLNEKALAQHYPGFSGSFKGHIKEIYLALRNADKNLLLRFQYARARSVIVFLLDPRGSFVATDDNGKPVASSHNLSLEGARQGVRLYLDVGFSSQATLLRIFKLLVVQAKMIRAQVDMKLEPERLGITWRVVDVQTGTVQISGVDSNIIRDSLLLLNGTTKGTVEFLPMQGLSKEKLTFMRVVAFGEELDNWLVHLALTTWEQVGSSLISELSVPLADALLAVKRDVMMQTK